MRAIIRRMATHNVSYRVLRDHMGGEGLRREVAVCATPEELAAFGREGFLVREAAIGGDWLETLRDALDRLTKKEWPADRPAPSSVAAIGMQDEEPARSWGVILRHLLDKDAAFHDLLDWPPALSVARAMMGPLVRLRGLSGRIYLRGCRTAGHALAPTPKGHSGPATALVFPTARDRLPDLPRRIERLDRCPLAGAGVAQLAGPRAAAAPLRTRARRADAAPASRQHGDHPCQPVAPRLGHAGRPATRAHPVLHAVLASRVAARWPTTVRRPHPEPRGRCR